MDISASERRKIENEMIFRRANEVVGDKLDEIDANHIQDGNPDLVRNEDILLQFMCECSDEDCTVRIPIKLSVYQTIHKNRGAFIIKLKHRVDAIEKVIRTEDEFSVVEKNNSTAEPGKFLNKTTIDNSQR